ncbi:MAG: TetR/AcrR family transcriptional regulator [Clostridia bacterium]|nr:TetR/AcrR family transcriptional regulator [Clostridia bacterium]
MITALTYTEAVTLMDENYENPDLRTKLIIAGLDELDTHGVTDFSLRRVASKCGVSCAAPYRHFKNKDELILEIIGYIVSRWQLLEKQIEEVCSDSLPELITELSLALIRFRAANPEFRAVLRMDTRAFDEKQRTDLSKFTERILYYADKYFSPYGEKTLAGKKFMLISMIYGAGEISDSYDGEFPLETVRACLEELFG